ncbi:MAG TPA: hypothetical protein VJ869_11605 [Sphaerochaeta sp.]|nr:hypothetical protein [Sphaerochaeta sp.]
MVNATKSKNIPTAESKFPRLMVSSKSKSIVLMTSVNGNKGTGMMVVSHGENPIGNYEEIWDMSVFSDFKGSVTLENDKEAK